MKTLQALITILIIAITLAFSTIDQVEKQVQFQNCFSQKIQKSYFQKWISGVRGGGSGTVFYIQLKKPLVKTIQLEKLYFQKQVAKLYSRSDTLFTAHFISNINNQEIQLESSASNQSLESAINDTQENAKIKFVLKDNEAVLEYLEKNKTKFFKIKKVKEIPLIPYP